MERYVNLFRLPEKLYIHGSPLLIAAGALLKDNQTGNILAQLKFRNISNKEIKAVKVCIKAFDVSGTEVQGIKDYQYLDLSAFCNAEFGQKMAVLLPDRVTRSFSVACTSVIFSDNTTWESEENVVWQPLPQQQNLEDVVGNLGQQYQRDTSIHSRFEPLQYDDLWLCSCGQINQNTESQCFHCQLEKAEIFSALNLEELEKKQVLFEQEEQERKKEKERQEAIKEEEAKKRLAKINKILIIFLVCILLIAGIIALTTKILIPMYQYNSALSTMEAGEYDKAIEGFEKLGDFKDSQEQINEAKYRKGSELLEQELFSDAAPIFASIEDYKDSKEKLEASQKEPQYRKALSYIEKKNNLENAYHTLIKLGDYKDSEDYLSKFSVVLSSVEYEYSKPVQLTYSDTGKIQSIRIGDDNLYAVYKIDDNLFPESVRYYSKGKKNDFYKKDYKIAQEDVSNKQQIQLQKSYKEGKNSTTSTTSYTYNSKSQKIEDFYYYAEESRYESYMQKNKMYYWEASGYVDYQNSETDNNTIQQINTKWYNSEWDSYETICINLNYNYLYDEGKMNTCDLPLFEFYFIQELLPLY